MREEDKFITVPEMSTLISDNFGINISEDDIVDIVKKLKMEDTYEYSMTICSIWEEKKYFEVKRNVCSNNNSIPIS